MTATFKKFANWLKKFGPLFTTCLAAMLLSSVWTLLWLIVFFTTTWFLHLSTHAYDFIIIFWFSIAVEALIRYGENHQRIINLSKPLEETPKADNEDYTFNRTAILFLLVFFAFILFAVIAGELGMREMDLVFESHDEKGWDEIKKMWASWISILQHPYCSGPLLLGTVFRSVIYKRKHK